MTGRRLVVAALVAVLSMGAMAGPASAHAVLISSDPAPDEMLGDGPDRVVLGFNEPISVASDPVVVLDPFGTQLDGAAVEVVGNDLVAVVPPIAIDGSYTVGWRVISDDGHPISGAFLFHVQEATLREPLEVDFGGSSLGADVLRALGITVALGGSVLVGLSLLTGRRRPWQPWLLVVGGAVLVLVGSLVGVGGAVGESFQVVLDTTMGSASAAAVLVAIAGLVVALTIPPLTTPSRVAQLGVVAAAVVFVGLSGHAVSLPPVARSAPATVLHVLAAVVWLVVLLRLVRVLGDGRGHPDPARVGVQATTPWALASVVVLAVTGAVLVADRVPFDEMLTSGYGQLSLVKSALLVVAVVLAALNRFRFAPRLADDVSDPDGGSAVPALRRSVRLEVVVVALALVAGSAVAQVAPPSASTLDVVVERATFGDGEVELSVEPLRRGTNEIHVIAFGDDGRLMAELDDLRVELYLPDRDFGPLTPEIQPVTGGHIVSFADVPLRGDWEFIVTARKGRFEELRAVFEVPVEN